MWPPWKCLKLAKLIGDSHADQMTDNSCAKRSINQGEDSINFPYSKQIIPGEKFSWKTQKSCSWEMVVISTWDLSICLCWADCPDGLGWRQNETPLLVKFYFSKNTLLAISDHIVFLQTKRSIMRHIIIEQSQIELIKSLYKISLWRDKMADSSQVEMGEVDWRSTFLPPHRLPHFTSIPFLLCRTQELCQIKLKTVRWKRSSIL
jgi:hypothetical protein